MRELKEEISRFVKLFLDVDVSPAACVPTVGSMMGSMAAFLTANRNDRYRKGTVFLDPGFPVQKQQCRILGHEYESIDVYNCRGEKLKERLESVLAGAAASSILYSNPNNPAWICFTEEELRMIGELSMKYDVIVIEDLAYFGMDYRQDYSRPGSPPSSLRWPDIPIIIYCLYPARKCSVMPASVWECWSCQMRFMTGITPI